jgi:hypothetical protein
VPIRLPNTFTAARVLCCPRGRVLSAIRPDLTDRSASRAMRCSPLISVVERAAHPCAPQPPHRRSLAHDHCHRPPSFAIITRHHHPPHHPPLSAIITASSLCLTASFAFCASIGRTSLRTHNATRNGPPFLPEAPDACPTALPYARRSASVGRNATPSQRNSVAPCLPRNADATPSLPAALASARPPPFHHP